MSRRRLTDSGEPGPGTPLSASAGLGPPRAAAVGLQGRAGGGRVGGAAGGWLAIVVAAPRGLGSGGRRGRAPSPAGLAVPAPPRLGLGAARPRASRERGRRCRRSPRAAFPPQIPTAGNASAVWRDRGRFPGGPILRTRESRPGVQSRGRGRPSGPGAGRRVAELFRGARPGGSPPPTVPEVDGQGLLACVQGTGGLTAAQTAAV